MTYIAIHIWKTGEQFYTEPKQQDTYVTSIAFQVKFLGRGDFLTEQLIMNNLEETIFSK